MRIAIILAALAALSAPLVAATPTAPAAYPQWKVEIVALAYEIGRPAAPLAFNPDFVTAASDGARVTLDVYGSGKAEAIRQNILASAKYARAIIAEHYDG